LAFAPRLSLERDLIYSGASTSGYQKFQKEPAMSKPTIEQTRMGTEAIAFCIARTLIERDPSLKAPMRANLRKMWELLEEREDHAAADMVDTMIKALNDPAFFKP
jgi:DNA-binding ferritin-like protein